MGKPNNSGRLDELTLGEYRAVEESELKALRCASLRGPDLEVDRLLLARLLVERQRITAAFESAQMLIEALDDLGLIPPAGDDETAIAKYASSLRHFISDAE